MSKRLAVLADIHGNLPALEAVLADMERFQVDKIVCAGDMVAGPSSAQVVHRLNELGAWMVRGNNEEYLLRFDSGLAPGWWQTAHQWAFIRWVYQHMDEESLQIIRSLPQQRVISLPGKDPIRMVHGSPQDPNEHLYPGYEGYALERALEATTEPVLICGHTHIPWKETRNGCLAFNPGAVCSPLDGFIGAQYALLDWNGIGWDVEFQAIAYDIDRAIRDYKDSGLLDYGGPIARGIVHDLKAGDHQVFMKFLQFAFEEAARAGYKDCEFVPDEILDQAAEKFDWEE